jgi:predicted nucleic acid-binding protein
MASGLQRMLAELEGSASIALDTSACVYYLSGDRQRAHLTEAIIERAALGAWEVKLPAIVELELLTGVFMAQRREMEGKVVRFIDATPGVSVIEAPRALMRLGARTRAHTGLRTPDALVVSAAMLDRCPVLVGNDRRMKAINRLSDVTLFADRRQQARFPRFVWMNDYVD